MQGRNPWHDKFYRAKGIIVEETKKLYIHIFAHAHKHIIMTHTAYQTNKQKVYKLVKCISLEILFIIIIIFTVNV